MIFVHHPHYVLLTCSYVTYLTKINYTCNWIYKLIYINNRKLSDPYIDEENGMLNIVRKVLNSIPSMRIVYRQESVMEMAKPPLTMCSEQLIPAHTIGYYRIDKPTKSDSLMSLYSKRNELENDLNFIQFFYKTIASK